MVQFYQKKKEVSSIVQRGMKALRLLFLLRYIEINIKKNYKLFIMLQRQQTFLFFVRFVVHFISPMLVGGHLAATAFFILLHSGYSEWPKTA